MVHTIAVQATIIVVLFCVCLAICLIGIWREMWTAEKERQLQAVILAQSDTITRLKFKTVAQQNALFVERGMRTSAKDGDR